MGYESKVFVINRCVVHPLNNMPDYVFGEEIARFDMCKMGYEKVNSVDFPHLFNKPIDFDLYYPIDEVAETREDCYGDTCGMTSVSRVINWLEKAEVTKEYRRAKVLLDCLRGIKAYEQEFEDIVVVHFGY